jgi:hypothetical protein
MAHDVQAMQYIQAKLSLAIHHQHQAKRFSLLMVCYHKHKGRIIFMLALVNYAKSVRLTKSIIDVDFLFMTVFPEQEVPHLLPVAINHSFDSLSKDWCYVL